MYEYDSSYSDDESITNQTGVVSETEYDFMPKLPKHPNDKQRSEGYSTMSELQKAFLKIDLKYSKYGHPNQGDKNLMMLLQDFDSLGLPEIDPSLPLADINRQVIINSKLLVEMYRRNLNKLDEDKLSFKTKDTSYGDLQKKLSSLKVRYDKLLYQNKSLEALIDKLKRENSKMNDMLSLQKIEMKKLKLYYTSKQNELQHTKRKLEKDNQNLKNLFGQDVGKYISKEDVIVNYGKKFKLNEQIYENTINQLQKNNARLLEELTKYQ